LTPKHFTPAQATKTLPLVKQIVTDILERARLLRALKESAGPDTGARSNREDALEAELHEYFAELEQLGCSYRDWGFEMGLVDFPSTIEGEPVLLCWRSDEPTVGFYHAADAGYAGRKPIPTGLLEANKA
jgi:hypothetical protein